MTKQEEFRKNGYIVIRNALSEKDVQNLRDLSFNLFEEKRQFDSDDNIKNSASRTLYTKTFLKHPSLINVAFKTNIVDVIKEVLGEDYMTFLQFSLYDNLHSPVWHTDAQNQGPAQYLYHKEYNVAKCGLYLQEDHDVYGGQLEIIPGSHLPSCLGVKSFVGRDRMYGRINRWQLLAMSLRNKFLKKVRVKLECGDILLFHALLWHRASQPDWQKVTAIDTYGISNPPRDKNKFMIQWEVSQNNDFASVYATHQYIRGKNQISGLFFESNDVKFPNDFDTSTINLIEQNKCKIAADEKMIKNIETNNLLTEDGTPIVFL